MIRMSEFVTGIFILAALAVLVLVAFKPAMQTFGGGDRVTWVADFDNVALLKDRARVAVSGYDVGQVMSRETFAKVDPLTGASVPTLRVRVTMQVDADFANQCKMGTILRINQESLLGDRFIEVIPSLGGPELAKDGDAVLVATEAYTDWMAMLKGLKEPAETLLINLNTTVTKLNEQILSDENTANLSDILRRTNALLADAQTTVKTINEELADPEGLLARARSAADSGANLLGKLDGDYDELKGRVNTTLDKADKVLDDGNERLGKIGKVMDEASPKLMNILDTTETRLPVLFDDLEQTLADAQKMMQGIDDTVRNKDVAGVLYDARVTMQELTMTLRALRADFSQVIWGGPGVAQPAVPDPKNDLKNIQTGKPQRYGY